MTPNTNVFIVKSHCDCDHDLPFNYGRCEKDLYLLCHNQEEMILILPQQVETSHGQQLSVKKISEDSGTHVIIEGYTQDIKIDPLVLTATGDVVTFVNYNKRWYLS